MRFLIILALGSFLIPLSNAAQQTSKKPELKDSVEVNTFGYPVFSASGNPITYSDGELNIQKGRWVADGRPGDELSVGGCESVGALSTWRWSDYGQAIGRRGLLSSEVQGQTELIVTTHGSSQSGSTVWQIMHHRPSDGTYFPVYTSRVYENRIYDIKVADVVGDGNPEIVVLTTHDIEIWDQASRTLVTNFPNGVPFHSNDFQLHLVDYEGDGDLDILTSSALRQSFLDVEGNVLWTMLIGTNHSVVGQMDSDPSLELVLRDGRVIDVDSQSIQWQRPFGFGWPMAHDLDHDGRMELICVGINDLTAYAFDVESQSTLWTFPITSRGETILADLEGDGDLELVVGEGQHGDILIYDLASQQHISTIDNPLHGVTNLLVADTDSDGMNEIVWGAGHTSSGPDQMFVADWSSLEHEWHSVHMSGPYYGPFLADVTGDGQAELITACKFSGSVVEGNILVFSGSSFTLQTKNPHLPGSSSSVRDLAIAQLDGDSAMEMLICTTGNPTATTNIQAWDLDAQGNWASLWQIIGPFNDTTGAPDQIKVIDVDGDGAPELLCATHSGYVFSFDLKTQNMNWVAPPTVATQTFGPYEMEVGEVDGDASLEVVLLGTLRNLSIYDCDTHSVQDVMLDAGKSLGMAEPSIGSQTIFVGDEIGFLNTLEIGPSGISIASQIRLALMHYEELTIRNGNLAFFETYGALRMYNIDTGEEIWTSCRDYGDRVGINNVFGPNYLVTTGYYGLVGFGRH